MARHRFRGFYLALAWVVPCSCLALAFQDRPVFRSSTELINVDVVVSDTDGRAVRGLTAKDFVLTDRRKPQAIVTFGEVSHERASAASARTTLFPASLPLDVTDNQSSQADRLVIVVVDDLHIWKGRTERARELARTVITTLGAQASMAVLFTSGERSTQVTQDRSRLLAVANVFEGRQSMRRPHQAIDQQKAAPNPSLGDTSHDLDLAQLDNMNAAQKTTLQDFEDNLRQLQTMQDAARMLAGEDQRRKAFVLISEGMAKNMSGLFDSSQSPCEASGMQAPCYTDRAIRDVGEAMRRANVTTYAIDPRGKVKPEDMALELFPPPDCGVCQPGSVSQASVGHPPPGEDGTFRWDNPVRLAQDALSQFTEASGGFAVTDTDDLAGGLERIVEDLDHYYLLGFYADEAGGKGYRPLNVTVPAHPDWRVRFRRGYVPGNTKPAEPPKDALAALATGVMPKADLPLRVTAVPLTGKGKNASVAVAIEVTAPTGLMKDADSKLRDDVSYAVLVVDDKKAKVAQRTGRAASFTMSARDGAAAMPDAVTYQIPLTLTLPPGQYQLRVSATSKKLGAGGSVYADLTVPDFAKAPLVLSPIVLGYADGSHVPVGRRPAAQPGIQGAGAAMGSSRPVSTAGIAGMPTPVALGAAVTDTPEAVADAPRLPFDPALDREFTRADVLRTYFEVARAGKTPVTTIIMVIDATNRTMMAIDKVLGADDPGRVDLRLPLASLAAGAYRLRVTATDGRTVTTSETGMVVR